MIKQLLVLLLIGISIYLSGGSLAFAPFLHAEAVLLVFGGTFLLTWAAYSFKDMASQVSLQYANKCAISLGVLTTIIDLMVHLWFDPGAGDLARKLSASLAGLFYGVLLSKILIAPMVARASGSYKADGL